MAGVVITQSATGLQALAARLNALAQADLGEALAQIGTVVESQTRRRLADEKEAPDGSAWEPLTAAWQQRKAQKSSGGLLEYEGKLIDSIASEVSGDTVEIGSHLIYAAIHQMGGEPVGKPIPARPYLGLSGDNENELREVISAWLDQLMAP